ncbi:EsaB/YukD family protein [Micropruina sp.]|uniref:EsaB/YukD family protein n=1 Tax=Micropruina sp. TaxID=2737536 RepID=UPI00260D1075|nr:EsaB/YukD family protein [Micropruina sp.]
MSDYTRLTLRGSSTAADLVLPSDEPLAAMLPDILRLLDEPAAPARPLTLVTVLGEQLNTSLSLAEQSVHQGAIVSLVRLDEAPAPPEVADITQLAGDSVADRADRWRREWAVLAAALACLVIGRLGGTELAASGMPAWWLIGVAVVLAGAAIALARRGGHGAGWVVTALAAGLLAAPVGVLTGLSDAAATGAWLGAVAALLATVAQFGYADRGIALGGVCGAVLVAGWAALGLAGMTVPGAAGTIALVATLGLGLLPGVAMTVGGLTGLDDRVIEGGTVRRPDAAAAVAATHRGLNGACLALGAVIGAAGYRLGATPDGWAMGLAAAVAVVVVLRARVLPLAPQRLACFAAATAIAAGLAVSGFLLAPSWTLAGLGMLAVALVGAIGLRLSDQLRARLSRLGNTCEFLAVLAGVPLLLGLLGVYADLLAAF